jgi:hypothetical protein
LTYDEKSVVVLLKGGRLPSWYNLCEDVQASHSQLHVELMLSVAQEHKMMRLEGYRLISPMEYWERFWVIEFPSLSGAEAWIQAERAPPYGRYGYYEYHLARRSALQTYRAGSGEPDQVSGERDIDPHRIPELGVDRDVIVVLNFQRNRAKTEDAPASTSDYSEDSLCRSDTALSNSILAAESFELIAPQDNWDTVSIVELSQFTDVETWSDRKIELSRATNRGSSAYLCRKWSPEYFKLWAPRSTP